MIGLIFRVLRVADGYKGRIRLAAVMSFLKSLCAKAPFVVAYFLIAGFLAGTVTGTTCLLAGLALVLCIIVQSILQNAADRLQSAAGFEIFADKRKALGAHLRRLPMMGMALPMFFGYREPYFESIRAGYGDAFADTLYAITPDWMFFAMIALCVVGGILGGLLGAKVLKRHFKKAGMA